MSEATETPMVDHLRRFWQLLAEGKVRILVDSFHPEGFGGTGHWSSSSFSDDVAKALMAEHEELAHPPIRFDLPPLGYPELHTDEVIASLQKRAMKLGDDD